MSGKSVALSDRGNCRGDAPQYMDTAYSRDIARRLITAPKRTQKGTPPTHTTTTSENKSDEAFADDPSVFAEEQSAGDAYRYGIAWSKTGRLDLNTTKGRNIGRLKKRGAVRGNCCSAREGRSGRPYPVYPQ